MTTAATAPGTSFTEGTVEADGFTVRYFEAGEGDPVVVIHGAGGPRFSRALDLLAGRYRVILIEMPGFGKKPNDRHNTLAEMAGTIDQATQALNMDTYHLLGTSLGGAVALHLAVDHPARLRSLVLEAPAAFRVGGAAFGPDTPPGELRRRLRSHPDRVPAWEPPDPAAMTSVWPLLARLMSTPDYDEQLAVRLPDCPVRTLVVFGDEDGLVPAENGRTYRRLMPNCHYMLVHQAAHDIQADRPEAFAELVGDFLARGWAFLLPEESTLLNPLSLTGPTVAM